MATKAFNALKEVSSAGRRCLAPRGPPRNPCVSLKEPQSSESLISKWEPEAGLGEPGLGALRVISPWSLQLVQECNASVQSMKRTEELIHLSKKIHFEGKVSALSRGAGAPGGAALSPPLWGLQASSSLSSPPPPALCPWPDPCLLHPPRSSR